MTINNGEIFAENIFTEEETKNEMIYVYISFGIVCVFVIIEAPTFDVMMIIVFLKLI